MSGEGKGDGRYTPEKNKNSFWEDKEEKHTEDSSQRSFSWGLPCILSPEPM